MLVLVVKEMTDTTPNTALKKTLNLESYVEEAVNKVKSKQWATPAGQAMVVTSTILEGFAFIPGVGILGGALKLGSTLLNPELKLSDLTKCQNELIEDFDLLKSEIQSSADIISKHMVKVEVDLKEIKDAVLNTYNLVVDQRYKAGIEKVDAAFTNFVKGSHNMANTLTLL